MSFIKKPFQTHRGRVTIALIVIGIAVVLAFLSPNKEQDPNIFGTEPTTPTVGVTHSIGLLTVNKSVTYSNVQMTVTQVQEASAFSDDEKQAGIYTVRVNVHFEPAQKLQSPVGIAYAAVVRLMLSNGQEIAPKLVNASTVIFPQQPADGYFDFPVSNQVSLSSLMLKVGSNSSVAFNS
ncbi:MAG: hypothetical protein ABI406_01715 [Ktedonobacteraceae bacterium]